MAVDVAIVGAGPAGISAAIQLRRSGVEPVLLEKNMPGGLLLNANLVENYPGFPGGITGPELAGLFKSHLETVGQPIDFENVINIEFENGLFSVVTDRREIVAKIAVLASGTQPVGFTDFQIPDECSTRIFHEIFPIRESAGCNIIIVGAGDAAFDYALNLGRNNIVTILNRGEKISSLPVLRERAEKNRNIEYLPGARLESISMADEGLLADVVSIDETRKMAADYIVFAIGRKAGLDYLSDDMKRMLPELEADGKLYMVGDIKNDKYRQTAICAGDGIKTAMKIKSMLDEGAL